MRLSIFTVPRHFFGHSGAVQRNAVVSWKNLRPKPEIILIGNEEGIAQASADLGTIHVPQLVYNRWGTPFMDDAFRRGLSRATNEYCAFVSSDVLLGPSFMRAVDEVLFQSPRSIVVSCATEGDGKLTGAKVFLFPRDIVRDLPPLALGRPGWSEWLVFNFIEQGFKIVDITKRAHVVHQFHDHRHSCWGTREKLISSPEAKFNLSLVEDPTPFSVQDLLPLRLEKDRKIVALDLPKPIREKIIAGMHTFREGRLKRATILRDEALALDKEGRPKEALARVRNALDIFPNFPGIKLVEAICLMNVRQYDAAILAAKTSLEDSTFKDSALALIEVIKTREEDMKALALKKTQPPLSVPSAPSTSART